MKRVLVVEDYQSIQNLYSEALKAAGYEVLVAADGAEAGKIAAQSEPDVMLLDLLMPNVDGLQFLRDYDLKLHPNTKVIVTSNFSSSELSKEAFDLGVSQYLIKAEYTPKKIVEIVDKALEDKTPEEQKKDS